MAVTNEFYRKGVHIFIILIPLIYLYLGKWPSLMIFAPCTAIFVSLDYLRRSNPALKIIFAKFFGGVLRERELEGNSLCGASWTALAACIIFSLFTPEIAVTSFVILAISDAAASLVGKNIASQPFFEKTLAGSAAFFICGIIILFICGVYFHSRWWFYFFGLFAVFCSTMLEARPNLFKVDDNFIIPISFSIVMTFFDLVWNYSY